MNSLWNAAALSLGIATMATVLTALIAVPLAFVIGRRKFPGRSVLEGLIVLPLVLPPTVVGYLILVVMGRRGILGTWLYHWFGYSILMRIEGAVLAAMIVALPLCYMPARAAFAGVDRDVEDAARVCGATAWRLFFRISLPTARRGILAGIVLAFARAMGEFGATLMVYTWQPGHETLPILIYADYEFDHLGAALPAVGVLSLISLGIILLYNRALHQAHDKHL
jgi:molybdate transport system permease protein